MFGLSHSACSASRKTSWYFLKPLRNLIIGRQLADFFHDQTIFIKDCELYET